MWALTQNVFDHAIFPISSPSGSVVPKNVGIAGIEGGAIIDRKFQPLTVDSVSLWRFFASLERIPGWTCGGASK